MLAAVGLLAGCSGSGGGASLNPVDWWHGLEGGAIAETRPPPPNADAPYPNLGSVPAKPPPPDTAAQARIANALVADRGNAHYEQATVPLPQAHPPAGTPAATLSQGARPANGEQPNASLAAASAPPPPPPPPSAPVVVRKAPISQVNAAPLAAPTPPPSPAPAAAATQPAEPPPAPSAPAPAAAEDAAMPPIPSAPPAPPVLPGAPPTATAPTPPPVAPPPKPAPVEVHVGQAVPIPFPAGSAVLPAEALASIKQLVKQLVQQHGAASISVTGFGDATSTETAAQTAALPLALDRARAVAAQLMAQGVPSAIIRIAAEPQGSGAAARLVN